MSFIKCKKCKKITSRCKSLYCTNFPFCAFFAFVVGKVFSISDFEMPIKNLSWFFKIKNLPFWIIFYRNVMKTGKKCYFCNQLLLSIRKKTV